MYVVKIQNGKSGIKKKQRAGAATREGSNATAEGTKYYHRSRNSVRVVGK